MAFIILYYYKFTSFYLLHAFQNFLVATALVFTGWSTWHLTPTISKQVYGWATF